jgi:ubiquinone biosynthesis protein
MTQTSLIRTLFRTTRAIRTVVKDAVRARHIASILAKYGFSAVVSRERPRDPEEAASSVATRVVLMLEELGPTFVKFGQILSTRPDIIPPHLAARLSSLQDHVASIPLADVRRMIVQNLGAPPEVLFASFDEKPLASASIAQVHGAVTKEGVDVVIKVQRPGLKPTIESDLSLLRFLASRVLDVYPEAAYFDLKGMVEEFEQSLLSELDFVREREHIERFAENFAEKPRIHIPRVFRELSSDSVLTMERIRGRKLTSLDDTIDRQDVARLYLDCAYQMLFQDGFFHGDLHPGNVFLEPDGRLGVIDFGMVGRLSRHMRERVVDVIFSVLRQDLEGVARIWYSLGKPGPNVDYAAFERDVVGILERYAVGRPMDEIDMGAFLRALAGGAVRHGIRLPSDFTMMFKAMVTTEGLAKQVAKGINPVVAAKPYIEAVIKERYSVERLKSVAVTELIHMVDLSRELPGRIDRLLAQAESGTLRIRIAHDDAVEHVTRVSRALNRGSVALVVAAASVTGAITIEHGSSVLLGLPAVTLVSFTVAIAGIVWLGTGILRGR